MKSVCLFRLFFTIVCIVLEQIVLTTTDINQLSFTNPCATGAGVTSAVLEIITQDHTQSPPWIPRFIEIDVSLPR